jgi:hypothetical protein
MISDTPPAHRAAFPFPLPFIPRFGRSSSIKVWFVDGPDNRRLMNTKLLMVASSLVLGVTGLVTSFAPVELLAVLKISPTGPLPVIIQLLGALYLGFAIMNWTAKDSLIGGIYARPLSIGNCLHFAVGAIALFKHQFAAGFQNPLTTALVVYAIFASAFVYLIFGRGVACQVNPSAKS